MASSPLETEAEAYERRKGWVSPLLLQDRNQNAQNNGQEHEDNPHVLDDAAGCFSGIFTSALCDMVSVG